MGSGSRWTTTGCRWWVGAGIGVAVFPQHGGDAKVLRQQADTTCTTNRGRRGVCVAG
ncbi:hypothetical protein [Actinoplanes sp. ATCC 53533]|uniref:hypothetical protein n=1 Tax=Actinoplanes sp. ATCC 53533 TaxID=1288362 RepID=UPI0013157235|nr:hypothetical protein [Actinoplanes sp. ATCC 53533]